MSALQGTLEQRYVTGQIVKLGTGHVLRCVLRVCDTLAQLAKALRAGTEHGVHGFQICLVENLVERLRLLLLRHRGESAVQVPEGFIQGPQVSFGIERLDAQGF